MFLQVDQVHVSYEGVKALQGVSLMVKRGDVVAILGSNGAGKSTLVNTICGFVTPARGEVRFEGKRITGMPAHSIVKLGIVQVPEGRGIFGTLSVLENLEIGAYLVKDQENLRKTMEEIYEIFPVLKARRRQSGGSLSGGEQQMLAIGRAMMARPQLLLMDEPSLGLSPTVRKEVERVTKKINEEKTSIILVEQNAQMALRTAHQGVVLQNGRIVKQGKSGELLKDPFLIETYLS